MSREDKDKKWEQVQIKAFTSWFNSVLSGRNLNVEDIKEDLKDGTKMCHFLEIATNKKLIQHWNKTPKMRVHQIENQGIALGYIKNDLKVRMIGIGAEDLVDGNVKLTLGLLWSLFRRMNIESIATDGKSSEDGLLLWLQKTTEGYNHVSVSDFKDSFSDGMAFSALIHAFNPELIDFDSLDPANQEENLTRAFEIAETKLGIPKLLDVEDMMAGGKAIDERSVILYSSLFFHAWIADEERRKLAESKKGLASEMEELRTQLAESQARNAELETQLKDLTEVQVVAKDDRIAVLEQRLQQLLEEVKYLRERAIVEMEMRSLLEEKVAMLSATVEESAEDREASEKERARLRSELSEMREKSQSLQANLESLEEETTNAVTSAEEKEQRLRELEERKSRLNKEIQDLRDRVAREVAKRQEKSEEVERLRKEIQTYKVKEIVQGKAHVGLDCLRRNLHEHLEDLYRWRELNDTEFKDDAPDFDLKQVISDISGKNFEDQIEYLDKQLQEENATLRRIVQLNDSKKQLEDLLLKEGPLTMKGRKEWRRRWFRLIGAKLNYYEEENSEEVAGSIQLDQNCDVVRQKAVKDEGSTKKLWPLKITVGDRKLFVKAATKKERHSWFLALTSKIAEVNYLASCESANERPDTRILNVFSADRLPRLHLNGAPLSANAVAALVKGLPGRDEVEEFSVSGASLDDALFNTLADVLEKMSVKSLDLSNNGLTSASAERLAAVYANSDNIESINLAGNQVDDAGVIALAPVIGEKAQFTSLVLCGNKVSTGGAAALAEKIGESEFSAIHLANNSLGDDGATALADLIGKNKAIREVHLQGNGIGDAGASALAAALQSSFAISTVNLSNNSIGAEGAVALKNAFANNDELVSVDLSGNASLVSGSAIADLVSADGISFPQLTLARAKQ